MDVILKPLQDFWDFQNNYHINSAVIMNDPFWKHVFPFGSVLIYILMLIITPRVVKKPQEWVGKIIPIWNLGLSILSVFMFLGTLLPVVNYIRTIGVWEVLCGWKVVETPGPLIFWIYVFALSKFAELFDTFWILLKNPERPVEFLHWWHHITVLLFTWYAEMWRFGVGYFFAIMNSLVHTFMYYYYYQMSIGKRPSWAKPLTVGQILQMVVGTSLNGYWVYLYMNSIPCACLEPRLLLISCGVMYGSYLYLFCDFFVRRYIFQNTKPKKEEKKEDKKTK